VAGSAAPALTAQRGAVEPRVATPAALAGRQPRGAGRGRVPVPVVAGIGVAWLYGVLAHATGYAQLVHHDALFGDHGDGAAAASLHIHETVPLWAVVVLVIASWQVMTAAMMLPSSLPMVRLFNAVSSRQPRAGRAEAAFVGGYAVIWTAFAAAAFAGDALLHQLVERTPALDQRPWLIGGGVLALAGAFQFSSLKDRCLDVCRHPAAFLMPRYRRGPRAAFALGRSHGWFCLGCCWALMVVMCAAGIADLRWMAGLAALMAYEKIGRHGTGAAQVAGFVLLVWAGLVILHPAWLPAPFAGPQ
jgi:predicted metal-binding membrane protein